MATLIGIFAEQKNRDGRGHHNLPFDYVRAVEASGAIAVIIPSLTSRLDFFVESCHGFIFPGGDDIDPTLYHQEYSGARDCIIEGDRWLLSAMHTIIETTEKPILGICKGMQLLNVAHGGSLIQDITGSLEHNQGNRRYDFVDTASITDESFLADIFGSEARINSIHHQAVGVLGEGLGVAAMSRYDGEIEAIEHTIFPHYGTQWHPECIDEHRPLFHWFVSQCS